MASGGVAILGATVTAGHPQASASRAVIFIDGQNLYRAVKDAFGYTYPNYNVRKLAETVCAQRGWIAAEIRFYTGIPPIENDPFWHAF
jgi:hypothetical protein